MNLAFYITVFFLQDQVRHSPATDSQDGFFDNTIWFVMIVPLVVMFVVAIWNRKPKQTVREFTDADFDAGVLKAEHPVLVHFYRAWSIGDQCMIEQVENMASRKPPYEVGFVNADKNEILLKRYKNVESPALMFFIHGERVFQSRGVFDGEDVHAELMDLMERHQRG